jgi:hypothetical protein
LLEEGAVWKPFRKVGASFLFSAQVRTPSKHPALALERRLAPSLFFHIIILRVSQSQCFMFGAVYPSKSGQIHKQTHRESSPIPCLNIPHPWPHVDATRSRKGECKTTAYITVHTHLSDASPAHCGTCCRRADSPLTACFAQLSQAGRARRPLTRLLQAFRRLPKASNFRKCNYRTGTLLQRAQDDE